MRKVNSFRKSAVVHVVIIIALIIVAYFVIPALIRSAYGVTADDMTREQQVRLMRECLDDVKQVGRQSSAWSSLYPEQSARIIQMFWEYRTRER